MSAANTGNKKHSVLPEPVPEVTTTASPPRECCQASNWCW
jgi:hypothetical protein